ncbi:MAG: hypothetical protein WBG82_04840 [Parvibaculum sp.]|uniref:hypothetical protein n=1 Tax=Parvibaculum sp. TaxID=2024848 RepID=UPI003C71B4E9
MRTVEWMKKLLGFNDPQFIPYSDDRFQSYKRYVLAKIEGTVVGREPFYHLFIEGIFPDELYHSIERRMHYYRDHKKLKQRTQDNKAFVNRRFNLRENNDPETQYIRGLFSDPDVKRALLAKFYVDPHQGLVNAIRIHAEEFEYVYSEPGRFQNIHTDIPPKFLSMVFYIPSREVTADEADRNGTILYDKNLKPQSKAKYRPNSVGIFAQHFHSYHGFATTIDRPALVLFYVHPEEERRWVALRGSETAPYDEIKDAIEDKLVTYPLIEFGESREAIERARAECRINAPSGRVIVEKAPTLELTPETQAS